MEKEERKTVPRPESGREEENELVNLRYEVASAKRQISLCRICFPPKTGKLPACVTR